ncbi:MAG: class I tRNA ligase family protein, partial [Clostridia bacterium]|nr:class I tRNA ligase family protein [Clostridia bacterium]
DRDAVPVSELPEIDRWALSRLNRLIAVCREGYDSYQFHTVYHAVNNFCTIDMSKLYIDITKDRVYVEGAKSPERRSAQTVLWLIISAMTRLVSPLLAFTGEEIWRAMPHSKADDPVSVFLNPLPETNSEYEFDGAGRWEKLFDLRDDVMKALEIARAEKRIGKSLDASVRIFTKDSETLGLLRSFGKQELSTLFITSGCVVCSGEAPEDAFRPEDGRPIAVTVEAAQGVRCDRCWCYTTDGGDTPDGGHICARCAKIVSLIEGVTL